MPAVAVSEFEWTGRTGPFSVSLGEHVFRPNHTSQMIASALEIEPGDTVIEVGCGVGIVSIVAARLGAGRVIGTDISEEAIGFARANADKLGVGDRIDFRVGDLFDPVRGEKGNVVIGDVSGVPDEIGRIAGWFPDGRAGGPTGAEVPIAMLESLRDNDVLAPGGRFYLPTVTLAADDKILELAYRMFGEKNVRSLSEREFPLPDVVAKSKELAALMQDGISHLRTRGSRLLWRLDIRLCQMPPTGIVA